MSKQFSNTTTKDGLIQIIEQELGFNDGDISGNTLKLAQFTGKLNSGLDAALRVIFQADGTAHFDDANHTTPLPSISLNLVAGTQSYAFTTDTNSNLMLFFQKIICADSNGFFHDLDPVDILRQPGMENFYNGQNIQGMPTRYGKNGKYIVLDTVPNYSVTNGLKAFIGREGSYFLVSDTTKMPGIAGLFHEFLAYHAAFNYASTKVQARAKAIQEKLLRMQSEMEDFYGTRQKDEVPVLKPRITPFR